MFGCSFRAFIGKISPHAACPQWTLSLDLHMFEGRLKRETKKQKKSKKKTIKTRFSDSFPNLAKRKNKKSLKNNKNAFLDLFPNLANTSEKTSVNGRVLASFKHTEKTSKLSLKIEKAGARKVEITISNKPKEKFFSFSFWNANLLFETLPTKKPSKNVKFNYESN